MQTTPLKLLILIITSSFLLGSSCSEQVEYEEQLPTGENTMYYYLNGVLTIPKGNNEGGIYTPAIGYSYCYSDTPSLNLSTFDILLHFHEGISQTGIITLNNSSYEACDIMDNHAFCDTTELWEDGIFHTTYYYTHNGTGEVNITYLSEDKQKFKGTFQMTVYRETTGETKEITEGHFNINLDTL